MMPPEKVTVLVITAVIAILVSVTLLNSSQEAARDRVEAWQVASAQEGNWPPNGEPTRYTTSDLNAGAARTRLPPKPKPPTTDGPSTSGTAEDPTSFTVHTIRKGDTLGALALHYLGKADARPLLAANPGLDPRKLRLGTEIRIPRPRPPDDDDAPSRTSARSDPAPIPTDSPARWYTVGPGDSLQRISQKTYGTTRHWRTIYDANRGRLRSPDWVKEGQALFLPPL
jgi:nucleoid-associated protein YgaU